MADEAAIRAAERCRVADLLDEHAWTLGNFALGKPEMVKLIAFLLRLGAAGGGSTPKEDQAGE